LASSSDDTVPSDEASSSSCEYCDGLDWGDVAIGVVGVVERTSGTTEIPGNLVDVLVDFDFL